MSVCNDDDEAASIGNYYFIGALPSLAVLNFTVGLALCSQQPATLGAPRAMEEKVGCCLDRNSTRLFLIPTLPPRVVVVNIESCYTVPSSPPT